jgi:hypothetical protein
MCRVIGYLIVAGLTASPLRGQDIAQMQQRLDSTFREAMIARQTLLDYRATHPPTFRFSDSIVAFGGQIKVYFDSQLAAQVRAGFTVAEKHMAELGQALERAEPMVFSVTPDSLFIPYAQRYDQVEGMNIRQHFAKYPQSPTKNSVEEDPESIAYVFLRAASATVGAQSPSRIVNWVSGNIPIAPDVDEKVDWASMRLVMVSSASHLGRSCYLGDIRACRVFLELDAVIDPIRELYDAPGRRRRVSYEEGLARRYSAAATDRCLVGNDDACVSVMQGMYGLTVLSSPYMRTSVVIHALRLGGPRAAERLLLTPGKPADALAAAAKMPLDSLLKDWQAHLDESNAAGSNVPWAVAISSIAWMALCVFLALRGSRWR